MINFAEKLDKLLNALSVRQVDLAKMTELDTRNINHYIKGRREPSLETVGKIAKNLCIPVGYFFGEYTLEEVVNTRNSAYNNEIETLRKNLDGKSSAMLIKYIEMLMLAEKKHFPEILELLTQLDESGLQEVLKQAEKEKKLKDYNNILSNR